MREYEVLQTLRKEDVRTVHLIQPQPLVKTTLQEHKPHRLRQEERHLKHKKPVPVKDTAILYLPPQLHRVPVLVAYVAGGHKVQRVLHLQIQKFAWDTNRLAHLQLVRDATYNHTRQRTQLLPVTTVKAPYNAARELHHSVLLPQSYQRVVLLPQEVTERKRL